MFDLDTFFESIDESIESIGVTYYTEDTNINIKSKFVVEEIYPAIERVLNAFAAPDNSFSIENFPFPCVKGASKEGLIYSFGQA